MLEPKLSPYDASSTPADFPIACLECKDAIRDDSADEPHKMMVGNGVKDLQGKTLVPYRVVSSCEIHQDHACLVAFFEGFSMSSVRLTI